MNWFYFTAFRVDWAGAGIQHADVDERRKEVGMKEKGSVWDSDLGRLELVFLIEMWLAWERFFLPLVQTLGIHFVCAFGLSAQDHVLYTPPVLQTYTPHI